MDSAPAEIASTIQAASIERNPDPAHDLNPSTAASSKEPVQIASSPPSSIDEHDDEIPLSALRPAPRKTTLPPLPDLRFEQSYLKSIEHASGWRQVAYITFRDQVVFAFVQGMAWTLIVSGWRHWNRGGAGKFSGRSVGARLRRWWWGVNEWSIPDERERLKNSKLGKEAREFYKGVSNAGSD